MRRLMYLTLVLAACGGDDGTDPDDIVNCDLEPNLDEFTVGLEKTGIGGKLTFGLVSATPAQPARYDNTWVIRVTDAMTNAPVENATMYVTPFMPPPHNHGTPVDPEVTAMPTAGEYEVDPVNLSMPAVWEVTFEVEAPVVDEVVFRVCVPAS